MDFLNDLYLLLAVVLRQALELLGHSNSVVQASPVQLYHLSPWAPVATRATVKASSSLILEKFILLSLDL